MGSCLRSPKETDKVSTIYNPVKICYKCNKNAATMIRKLVLGKVPLEYIVNPCQIPHFLIVYDYETVGKEGWFGEDKYLLNFPKEYVLTRYDYYACTECYEQGLVQTCEWTVWEKY